MNEENAQSGKKQALTVFAELNMSETNVQSA